MAEIKWLTNGLVDSTETGEFPAEAQQEKNPVLTEPVEAVNPMKEWLIDYVGNILKPADGNVTTEMIVHAFGVEFPELALSTTIIIELFYSYKPSQNVNADST